MISSDYSVTVYIMWHCRGPSASHSRLDRAIQPPWLSHSRMLLSESALAVSVSQHLFLCQPQTLWYTELSQATDTHERLQYHLLAVQCQYYLYELKLQMSSKLLQQGNKFEKSRLTPSHKHVWICTIDWVMCFTALFAWNFWIVQWQTQLALSFASKLLHPSA